MEENKKDILDKEEKGCGCHKEEKECGCHKEEKDCGCHKEEKECGCHEEKKDCGCHKEEKDCGCHEEKKDCGCHKEEKECGCHKEEKECGCHKEEKECGCHKEEGSELLAKLQKDLAEAAEKYIKLYADFENYKKRAAKDRQEALLYANTAIFEKLLLVMDNFDRALKNADEEDPFQSGVALVSRQLKELMASEGLHEIEAVNLPFDPICMNAVMIGNQEDVEDDIVTEQFQKGYRFKDRVIRPSMVKVNKH